VICREAAALLLSPVPRCVGTLAYIPLHSLGANRFKPSNFPAKDVTYASCIDFRNKQRSSGGKFLPRTLGSGCRFLEVAIRTATQPSAGKVNDCPVNKVFASR